MVAFFICIEAEERTIFPIILIFVAVEQSADIF